MEILHVRRLELPPSYPGRMEGEAHAEKKHEEKLVSMKMIYHGRDIFTGLFFQGDCFQL